MGRPVQIASLMSLGGNKMEDDMHSPEVEERKTPTVILPADITVVNNEWLRQIQQQLEEYKASLALEQQRSSLYRDRVREEAIRVAKENGWCNEGLNMTLENLDLEPVTQTYRVIVRVHAYQDVELDIQAGGEDEVEAIALSDEYRETVWDREIDGSQWETDSINCPDPQIRRIQVLS